MKASLGSLLILSPLAILLLANCEARSPGTSAEFTPKASLGAAPGLDTNDVSILLPLPTDKNSIGMMLPLAFTNGDGTTPMTASLFADIISHHKYTDLTDGKKTPLNSGARFDGKGRIKKESRTFGPYDQLNDWRIISMRFDPCAPSPTQNLRGHGLRQNPAAFDPVQCLPQLRLITQPVFDKEREESRFDGPVMVGDYAIHLLFTLSETDVKAVYQELTAFRDSCGDMTSSMPLGVHPCLVAAKNRGAYGGDEFQKVYGLIKRFAKQLDAVAMMATQSGDDPWVFMNGFV